MTEDWTNRTFTDVPAGATPAPGTESIDAEFLMAFQTAVRNKLNQSEADVRYLQLAGGTLTGGLAVGANSLQPNADNVFGSTSAHNAIFKTNNVERARFDSSGVLTFPNTSAGRLKIYTDGKILFDSNNAFGSMTDYTWRAVQRYTASRTNKDYVIGTYLDTQGGGSAQDGHIGVFAYAKDRAEVANRSITNVVSGTGSVMRLTVTGHGFTASEKVHVYGITGSGNVTALNGNYYSITVVDANTIELVGTTFGGAYTSGGTASNRGLYYGMSVNLAPSVDRGGLTGASRFGDDVAGITVSSTGVKSDGRPAKITDAIYLSTRGSTLLATRLTVANAGITATSPIEVTTTTAHGLVTGDVVNIYGSVGITAANGTWTITVVDTDTFTLNGSSGSGTYTGSAMVAPLTLPETNTAFTSDMSGDYGIRINGNTRYYGLDFKDGAFGVGQLRLKNDNYVVARNSGDTGDLNMFKANTLNEMQIDVPSRWNNALTISNTVNFAFSTATGTKIGTGSTQKIGFWNATPVVQPSLTYSRTGESTAEAQIRAALAGAGLVADSTTA